MSKKNIAFLLTKVETIGGISRAVSVVTNALCESNLFNVHIIGFQKHQDSPYGWHKDLIFHNLIPEERISMKKGIFRAVPKLRKVLHVSDIDVLVSCGDLVGILGALSTRFKKTKFVFWSHSSFKAPVLNKFKDFSEQFTARFADVVVSLTKADQQNYRNETKAKRVVQIYNPVDPKLLEVDREYNPSSKKIISVGRLDYPKNFLLLVDVAKIVLEKNPDYQWHIYGIGDDEKEIKEKLEKNGLEGKLELMGLSNDLYRVINEYGLMVMTSRFEGFPMSLIEGMACKLPLISFDIATGPNEIIKNGDNGYLIEPLNVVEMASCINELIKNTEKRVAFSEAQDEILPKFEMNKIRQIWIELFNSL